jgi:hypothetical protein
VPQADGWPARLSCCSTRPQAAQIAQRGCGATSCYSGSLRGPASATLTAGACLSHAGERLHCRPWCVQVEDVLQLSEELALAELPDDFQATALRELEQEACTQLAELLQSVLRLDG